MSNIALITQEMLGVSHKSNPIVEVDPIEFMLLIMRVRPGGRADLLYRLDGRQVLVPVSATRQTWRLSEQVSVDHYGPVAYWPDGVHLYLKATNDRYGVFTVMSAQLMENPSKGTHTREPLLPGTARKLALALRGRLGRWADTK